MSFNRRDPRHRVEMTFPGKPVARRVPPLELESYLRAKGYERARLGDRSWPEHVPDSWWPPLRYTKNQRKRARTRGSHSRRSALP